MPARSRSRQGRPRGARLLLRDREPSRARGRWRGSTARAGTAPCRGSARRRRSSRPGRRGRCRRSWSPGSPSRPCRRPAPSRIRPRRCASSTAGSSSGSTRLRIGRDCNGRAGRGDRTHATAAEGSPRALGCHSWGDRADRRQRPPDRPSLDARLRSCGAWPCSAYAVAVFHRASLGVAAVDAQERFSAGASAISLFLVLQLAVYAGAAGAGRRGARPLRLAADDPGRRAHHGRRAARAGAGRPTCPPPIARPRAGRRRRRDDLHQRAAGDRALVPRPAPSR